MKTFGERLHDIRLERGIAQNVFAEMIGEKSGKVVWNWENGLGKPDVEKIVKICAVLQEEVLSGGGTALEDRPANVERPFGRAVGKNILSQFRDMRNRLLGDSRKHHKRRESCLQNNLTDGLRCHNMKIVSKKPAAFTTPVWGY